MGFEYGAHAAIQIVPCIVIIVILVLLAVSLLLLQIFDVGHVQWFDEAMEAVVKVTLG